MPLTPGTIVGRYEVRELLGSGGMGEVYKAHDPTLGRLVALKVLRETLNVDTTGVNRFLQEARAASALNHPNILTIHEVGEHQHSRFIVSEFVEGETLRHRLDRGPLTLREILDVTAQTASALAAAHAAGIVHRDIKPENLMLRPDGYVKVLDFGVAKLAERAAENDPGATVAPADTGQGMVVGTVAYMAPEQARGLNVDGRADAFSLGVVLYELVTGRTPFAGPTTSDTLVAILDREPPSLRQHAKGLPPPLEWAITKALDKDPNLRYQSIADLRVDLLRLKAAIESGRIGEMSATSEGAAAAADRPIEVELTEDHAAVRSVSTLSRFTYALAGIGAAALVAAMIGYSGRPGADLPLQVPEGAVITKARDAALSLGYSTLPARTASNFDDTLDVADVAALAGLSEAREAVRAGVVGVWAVGASPTRDPNGLAAGGVTPQEGDFTIGLNPNGQINSFATGVSQQPTPAPDRDKATRLGLDTIRRVYGVDASPYELEYVQRAFPAGTVEMTWRNPARKFGHIEQMRVHVQGDRIVRVERSFEKPPGYTEPDLTLVAKILKPVIPWVVGAAFVVPYVFGLYVLFKTRSWDALRQRVPIALCAIIVVSVAAASSQAPGWQVLVGLAFLILLMISTGLPSLSGLMLWIRRRAPARLWAADELVRGHVLNGAVSVSLLEGVLAGAAMAGIVVLGDLIGLRIPGYLPSISRELNAVDQGAWNVISDGLTGATFLAIGIALGVEACDRARIAPWLSTLLFAAGFGLVVGAQHLTFLAVIPVMAGQALVGALGVMLYRVRGLLAVWIAMLVSELLPDAMAARALDDPGLATVSTILNGLAIAIAGLGLWGLVAGYLKRKSNASAVPA